MATAVREVNKRILFDPNEYGLAQSVESTVQNLLACPGLSTDFLRPRETRFYMPTSTRLLYHFLLETGFFMDPLGLVDGPETALCIFPIIASNSHQAS